MDLQVFADLPDESRLFVHGFPKPLTSTDKLRIQDCVGTFIPEWDSHRRPVTAACAIYCDRFLITAAYCRTGLSGCSMDRYIQNFKHLKQAANLDGLNGGLVYFRDAVGDIQAAEHLDFFDVVARGEVTGETPVFDTLVAELAQLRSKRFEIPFRESWHARTYGLRA
jgi:hypothetical protein